MTVTYTTSKIVGTQFVSETVVGYQGATLGTRNGWNGLSECEVYFAIVWDDAAGEVTQICYGSDRGYEEITRPTIDATPEVVAKVNAWEVERKFAELKFDAVRDAKEIAKGKTVVVARGRKVAKGTVGVVKWMGQNQWGTSVGLKVAGHDGLVFTDVKNVDVQNPVVDEEALMERAKATARTWNHVLPRVAA